MLREIASRKFIVIPMALSAVLALLSVTTIMLQQCDARKCPIGQRHIDCACLKPCSKVCRNIQLPCEPFLGESPDASVSTWIAAENTPCFQVETDQLTGEEFLRTSCKCPNRIYSDNDNHGALSNCILSSIVENEEINFGRLEKVQLGVVRSLGDIDFEGDTKRNQICLIDTDNDFELEAFIKFSNNVIHSIVIADELQFEPGVIFGPNNIFTSVDIANKFRFVEDEEDSDIAGTVKVILNKWGNMVIDECVIETAIEPIIRQNQCESAIINDPSSCGSPIAGNFDCITET